MDLDSATLERAAGEQAKRCGSDELVRRIGKLRWMGMDDEAEELRSTLREFRQAAILLSGPNDTD
ncbi:hypothetical protein [Methylovirgula sp. HY1]|uniref:hypothetical protein n=1 Tax=Methylovirgula sp. HY1 TaxID=2822761 RepID=UPI001C5ACF53|nr:hypothetical protein [Methylovirgula sp. HY1]QXX73407.1 hypothetical protein MHY1_00203 [Methylovirgula sp. HY1]